MSANLMVDPEKLDATLPVMKKLLGGYTFRRGEALFAIRPGRQDREVRPVGAGRRRRGRPGGEGGAVRQARRSSWASSGRRSSSASSASASAIKKFLFGRKRNAPGLPPATAPPPQAAAERRRPVSDLAELYLVFALIYVFECGAFVPRRALGLVRRFGRWRARPHVRAQRRLAARAACSASRGRRCLPRW